uniref:Uncharacterized protein n=1 Tax=uncultured marine virus TaxID=186617 RepID=A0A0F7L9L9_9VIRU|nr:hypothetical protein [uncultured marine virus]
MKNTWYSVCVPCPTCNGETVLQLANYSSDGELWFVLYCATCKELVNWHVFGQALSHRALIYDFDKSCKKCHQTVKPMPVRPPLALPRAPDVETEADKKFERECGIEPGDLS